jgi:hypothetical protein
MKKVVRLTESQLKDVIKRVISEQTTEVDYNQISNELRSSLMGETSYFIPPGGGSPYGFKIENVSVPQDILKGRTIVINGLSGVVGNNRYIQSPDPANLVIEYTCKTSANEERNQPVNGSSNLTVNPAKEGFKDGVGMINKDLANYIEATWCQKLPYHSGGGGRFMNPNS